MYIAHRQSNLNVPAKKKRVPLYKNEEAIEAMVKTIIKENDERLLKTLKNKKSPASNQG